MYKFNKTGWHDISRLDPKSFICWNCNKHFSYDYDTRILKENHSQNILNHDTDLRQFHSTAC